MASRFQPASDAVSSLFPPVAVQTLAERSCRVRVTGEPDPISTEVIAMSRSN
jgi:hypothetical protein